MWGLPVRMIRGRCAEALILGIRLVEGLESLGLRVLGLRDMLLRV